MRFFLYKIILVVIFVFVLMSVIALARGYRPNLSQKKLVSTGIIVANSKPDGAKVFLNGKLEGATNTNIVVNPGQYTLEIKKDGYTHWKKDLTVKGELVVKLDALLFPQNPTLSPVTSLGILNGMVSPTNDKIILLSQSGDTEKDGIYLYENNRNPINLINQIKPLILHKSFPQQYDLSKTEIEFSPDQKEILLTFKSIQTNLPLAVYLISTQESSKSPFEVTRSVDAVRIAWEKDQEKILTKSLETYKKPLRILAEKAFDIIQLSPNEEKILYIAKETMELPIIITPRLVSTNQTPETRALVKGHIYIYDSQEDKNFELKDFNIDKTTPAEIKARLMWYPTSGQIVIREDNSIAIVDYDGTNKRSVYSGPFEKDFLAVTPDGKLFILTNFNTQKGSLPDLYSVGIQ